MIRSILTSSCSAALLAVSLIQPVLAKSFTVQCTDGTKVHIKELFTESTHRYPLGDLIEARISNQRTGASGKYRLSAAGTGSFGGRWIYTGPPGRNFSLLLSGRSPIWYLDFEGQKPLHCAPI
jgi:hypothetical protein